MATHSDQDWNIGDREGLVNIGDHSLWLQAKGPSRRDNAPAIIIIPGLASSCKSWAAVQRILCPSCRVYCYERSGYGKSEPSVALPTAAAIARELHELLSNAHIPPPYIVVAHSWGGILSREFLALCPETIVGMVFVEANQEHTLQVLDWRQPALAVMRVGVNTIEATGLLKSNKLTSEEWEVYCATESTTAFQKQAALEFEAYPKSFPVLEAKGQLHNTPPFLRESPVCVIQGDNKGDLQKVFEAGVALGNGTATERAACQELLQTWDEKDRRLQTEILSLSNRSYFMDAPKGSGHSVHLTYPDLIVEGVNWVLTTLEEAGCLS